MSTTRKSLALTAVIAASIAVMGADSAPRSRADELRSAAPGSVQGLQVVVADAYKDAQRTKGEGDAQAARIYAEAFNRNPEFFSFYRSMEAYRQSLRNKSDVMVLDPSSDFFKYLKSPGRGKQSAP